MSQANQDNTTETSTKSLSRRYKATPFNHGAIRAEHSPHFKIIGERLRIARAVLNISEQEAADGFELPLDEYLNWEAGKPTYGHPEEEAPGWARFCERYDISTDWLLVGDGKFLKSHLKYGGKVAILPVTPLRFRKVKAQGQTS